MPKLSLRTLATGARQFVVHEALLMTLWSAGLYAVWFTPMQTVMSSFLAGAEMITLRAPASRCARALVASVKNPVELDDQVDTEVAPRQPLWVTLCEDGEPASVDGDLVALGAHRPGKPAEDGVVLEQVGEGGGVGEVVDGDDLELGVALARGAIDVASDPAEAVDANLDSHPSALLC